MLAFTTFPILAFEVGAEFAIRNLAFADTRTATDEDLPLVFPWGVSVTAYQEISDSIGVNLGFFTDPTLNFISYTLLDYRQQFLSLSVGPFFGLFNSRNALLKPGISTAVRADVPGIAFVSFRADSSIGGRLVQEGDYLQERSDVTIGFYVRNAICSVNLLTKSYIYRTETEEIVDGYTEYSFDTDLYQKNVPYRILLSFAYQERAKSFIDVVTRAATNHRLRSIVLGTEIDVQIGDWLLYEINIDSSVFSFGSAGDEILAMPTSGVGQFLFAASTGFSIQVDTLMERRAR